jgi:Ca-activated chloride channel family protein
MNTLLADFHFLRPLWLVAILPIILLLWLLHRNKRSDNAWRNVCDEHLLPYLLISRGVSNHPILLGLLGLGWIICALALAGPTWSKQPQPVFQILDSRIIVLDLSRSMDSPDLKPSRATRARFKVADILAQIEDGQVGLVVFAGDAFVVSPITRDADTIANMLPALLPEIMPVQGSRLDLGLAKAGELFAQAGVTQGTVIAITDGSNGEPALEQARALAAQGFAVSVLAVGSEQGAPIPTAEGDLLKDGDGNIVVARLNQAELQALARAGGGHYAAIRADNSDLELLLPPSYNTLAATAEPTDQQAESWQEQGPWLVLPLLPLAALAFRRGWLVLLVITMNQVFWPPPAAAWDWNDLWLRSDQQAQQALDREQPERALELASDPWQRGTAAYRAGNYEQAVAAFSELSNAYGYYNRGNALAQLGRYDEALQAYDAALNRQPDMEEAKANQAVVEELIQQQQEQQQPDKDPDQQPQTEAGDDEQQRSQDQAQGGQGQQSEEQQAQTNNQPDETGDDQGDPDPRDTDSGAEGEQQQQVPQQTSQQQEQDQAPQESEQQEVTEAEGEALSEEQRQVMEQWLRRIPDDPAGLLRRKFLYQYQRREAKPAAGEQTW